MKQKQPQYNSLKWQNFVKSEMGKEVLAFIAAERDSEQARALQAAQSPCDGAAIQEHTIKAAGIDLILQGIIALAQPTKNLDK